MDDYRRTLKESQAKAQESLQRELDEAVARSRRDPARVERIALAFELSRLRLGRGLTQAELARRARVRQADISLIESGKGNPRLSTLLRIIKALDADFMLEYKK